MPAHHLRTRLAALSLLALVGCAGDDTGPTMTVEPLDLSMRERLGSVAVAPVALPTDQTLPVVAGSTGAGAGTGAEQGMVAGAMPGVAVCAAGAWACLVGGPLAIGGMIVGSAFGAVVGMVRVHEPDDVAAAEAALRRAFKAIPAEEVLADRVVAAAREKSPGATIARSAENPSAAELSANAFESALLLGLPAMAVEKVSRLEGIDPKVTVAIAAQARLASVANGQVMWSRMWAYRSQPHAFFALAANDGQLLREEIVAGLNAVAATVADDVFAARDARTEPEIQQLADVPFGIVRTVRPSILAVKQAKQPE